jgi:hypothetical protein
VQRKRRPGEGNQHRLEFDIHASSGHPIVLEGIVSYLLDGQSKERKNVTGELEEFAQRGSLFIK